MWYVYALRSSKDAHLYIGISRDPQKRLKEHNQGMTPSTRNRRPFVLIYIEQIGDVVSARLREKKLKTGAGREFLKAHF